MMTDLTGKVAIVTACLIGHRRSGGASSGAVRCESRHRRPGGQAEGEAVVQKIKSSGGEAIFVKTDVAKLADHEALVAATLENLRQTGHRVQQRRASTGSGRCMSRQKKIGITK